MSRGPGFRELQELREDIRSILAGSTACTRLLKAEDKAWLHRQVSVHL